MADYECARCGGALDNPRISEAVAINALDADMTIHTLYLCMRRDKTHEGCASRVLTKTALAKHGPITFYDPTKQASGT